MNPVCIPLLGWERSRGWGGWWSEGQNRECAERPLPSPEYGPGSPAQLPNVSCNYILQEYAPNWRTGKCGIQRDFALHRQSAAQRQGALCRQNSGGGYAGSSYAARDASLLQLTGNRGNRSGHDISFVTCSSLQLLAGIALLAYKSSLMRQFTGLEGQASASSLH